MENEIWKPIVGYEDHYEVSNFGRVRSTMHRWGKREIPIILSPGRHRDGYALVSLRKCGGQRTFKIHRLMAEAFMPNPDNKPCIDHIDGNPWNNTLDNIRWCTMKENMNNPVSIDRHKKSGVEPTRKAWERGVFNGMKRRVAQISKSGELIKVWESASEASRELGISLDAVFQCCWGKKKTCGGYKWAYIEPGERRNARICRYEKVREELVK